MEQRENHVKKVQRVIQPGRFGNNKCDKEKDIDVII